MERVIYADECWIADPEVFKVNREEAHSDHAFYEEKVTEYGLDMPLRQSLNGTWKFSYADVPDKEGDNTRCKGCGTHGVQWQSVRHGRDT